MIVFTGDGGLSVLSLMFLERCMYYVSVSALMYMSTARLNAYGSIHTKLCHVLILTYHSHIIYSPVISTKFPYMCILYVDPIV